MLEMHTILRVPILALADRRAVARFEGISS